jgi:hypothetical protein
VRRSVVVSVLSWFVLDSAGAIASGNRSNGEEEEQPGKPGRGARGQRATDARA